MKIVVGSRNPVKLEGVRRAFEKFFSDVEISSNDVHSSVSPQPVNHETIFGAVNRAKNTYSDEYDFSVGVEAGLFEIPHTVTGYIDFQVACIYDGKRYTLGFGPGFEYPPAIVRQVLKGKEVGEVMEIISGIKSLGRKHGAIGFLTGKRIIRSDLTEMAVMMALIPWINRELYEMKP